VTVSDVAVGGTGAARQAPRRPAPARRLTGGVLLVALVSCAPVLTTRYGYVDDYTLLFDDARGRDVTSLGLAQGRPVAALLQWPLLLVIDGVSGLVALRLISVLSFAAMGVLLGRTMLSRGYSTAAAWTVAVGLFAIPSTGIMVAWSILYFGALAALAAAAAAVLAVDPRERPGSRPFLAAVVRRRTFVAMVLLSLAMLSYQPSAMVFWPCAFLMLAAPGRRPGWRGLVLPVWTTVVVGLAALVAGYVAVKAGALLSDLSISRTDLVTDPVNKVGFLLSEVVPLAMFPWLLDVRLVAAVVVAAALAAGLLLTLPGTKVDRLVMTALAGAAVVLGWLANLPIAENAPYARTSIGVMVAVVVVVGVVVEGVLRRAGSRVGARLIPPTTMVVVALLALAWMPYVLTTYVTSPASTELRRVEDVVRRLPSARPVTVLTAEPGTTLAPRTVADEFGRSTGAVYWALQAITELAYRDAHGDWPEPGRLSYPTDADYTGGRLREVPDEGWVLDYQQVLAPEQGPALYDVSRAP